MSYITGLVVGICLGLIIGINAVATGNITLDQAQLEKLCSTVHP